MDVYLDKIEPETTLKQLMEKLQIQTEIISVIDKNGIEITEDEDCRNRNVKDTKLLDMDRQNSH